MTSVTPTSAELVERVQEALRIMRRWAALPEIPGWRADAVDPYDAALTDLAARLDAARRDRDEAQETLKALYCSDDEYGLAMAAASSGGRDLRLNELHKSCVGYRLRAEAAEARLAKYERALREIAANFPGNNEMWRSVQDDVRRTLEDK